MRNLVLALILTVASTGSHAALISYDISSPDDLSNILVGQSVHFDVFLPGISAETWDDTAIFNASATSSDTTLWGAPVNVDFNSAMSITTEITSQGRVSWVHVDTPLSMISDFVMSFDIVATAVGSGVFSVSGADIFQSLNLDESVFTLSDSVDFNIVAAVPEPGIIGLVGIGLLALGFARRRKDS